MRAPNPGVMTLEGTNTWVLRAPGAAESLVIDPGPLQEEHLMAVAAEGPVAAVLLTHGHPDHAEGVGRFVELTGAPVRARDPQYGSPLPSHEGSFQAAGLRVQVLDTPGHTADSVSYVVTSPDAEVPRAVAVGDTILGRGSTVVAWPDGNLADYLASLERLRALGVLPVLTGHGPPLADAAAAAEAYLEHRRTRLDQVRAALAEGAATAEKVVARVYAEVDPALWPAAELSVRAQLEYLGIPPESSEPS
jgi:glyoxylase-like metal-dependent hydrolase (beta-lactamase superfamily II)